jgi:hypothetical protein
MIGDHPEIDPIVATMQIGYASWNLEKVIVLPAQRISVREVQ